MALASVALRPVANNSPTVVALDFELEETDKLIQKTARDYAERVVLPEAARRDREGTFVGDIVRKMGELGLLAVKVPESLGGAGAGAVAYALAMQEIAKACASTAVTMAVQNMVGEVVSRFGSDEQKADVCPKLASGQWLGSFALSEAEAGSDAGSMRTTATLDGDEWVLTGSKQWISSGGYADVFVVWARTEDKETHPGTRGISCFLVEKGAKGFSVGKPEDKMGLRASNTVPLEFDGCRIPKSALFGQRAGGFKIAMMALDGGRIGISSQAIGIARAALEASVTYAKERVQFDKPIAQFQAIQWKLADMATELEAAHLLSLRAAWLKDQGQPFSREASMAKLFASEAANRIANHAVQIHGGYGYIREFPVERYLRDVRVTTIYEGTSEVQRIVIARHVLA